MRCGWLYACARWLPVLEKRRRGFTGGDVSLVYQRARADRHQKQFVQGFNSERRFVLACHLYPPEENEVSIAASGGAESDLFFYLGIAFYPNEGMATVTLQPAFYCIDLFCAFFLP